MTDEYIRKEDAIDVAREDGKKIPTVAIRIMHDIKAIPAADVVVPVRCEDCVYHGYDERFKEHWCGFVYGIMKVTLDGYCSNGIKRGGKRKE